MKGNFVAVVGQCIGLEAMDCFNCKQKANIYTKLGTTFKMQRFCVAPSTVSSRKIAKEKRDEYIGWFVKKEHHLG